jgi:hypothetical protein
MTDPAKRERAALGVLALLSYRWALGPTSYDPGTGRWTYTARGPHPGRGKHPETITGTSDDELAAMIDLRIPLDERRRDDKLAEMDRRGRAALLSGAEERSRTVEGRPLTAYELERVTRRYPEG